MMNSKDWSVSFEAGDNQRVIKRGWKAVLFRARQPYVRKAIIRLQGCDGSGLHRPRRSTPDVCGVGHRAPTDPSCKSAPRERCPLTPRELPHESPDQGGDPELPMPLRYRAPRSRGQHKEQLTLHAPSHPGHVLALPSQTRKSRLFLQLRSLLVGKDRDSQRCTFRRAPPDGVDRGNHRASGRGSQPATSVRALARRPLQDSAGRMNMTYYRRALRAAIRCRRFTNSTWRSNQRPEAWAAVRNLSGTSDLKTGLHIKRQVCLTKCFDVA
jgi:hypothetical protein